MRWLVCCLLECLDHVRFIGHLMPCGLPARKAPAVVRAASSPARRGLLRGEGGEGTGYGLASPGVPPTGSLTCVGGGGAERHARLEVLRDPRVPRPRAACVVTDLASAGGTWLNGSRLRAYSDARVQVGWGCVAHSPTALCAERAVHRTRSVTFAATLCLSVVCMP